MTPCEAVKHGYDQWIENPQLSQTKDDVEKIHSLNWCGFLTPLSMRVGNVRGKLEMPKVALFSWEKLVPRTHLEKPALSSWTLFKSKQKVPWLTRWPDAPEPSDVISWVLISCLQRHFPKKQRSVVCKVPQNNSRCFSLTSCVKKQSIWKSEPQAVHFTPRSHRKIEVLVTVNSTMQSVQIMTRVRAGLGRHELRAKQNFWAKLDEN